MTRAVYINNTSAFLPNESVSNEQMESLIGLVGGKPSRTRRLVLRSNGIKQRYYAIDPATGAMTHTSAQLSAEAVRGLECEEFRLDDISCLVAATSSADQILPNHAVMVHGELGVKDIEVVATAGICVCGMSALKYGYMSILTGEHSNAVVTASELASALMHARNFEYEVEERTKALESKPELAFEKDFLRWMLSDAGGAVWLSDTPRKNKLSLRIEWIELVSYAHEMEVCMYSGAEKLDGQLKSWTQYAGQERESRSLFAIKQDVKQLNEHVVPFLIEKALSKVARKHQLNADDIDYFLPHYSSEFFRDKVSIGLKNIDFEIPQERWFTNLTTKGNTGAASIFVMLDELFKSGKLSKDEKLLCFIPESGRFSAAYMLLTVCE